MSMNTGGGEMDREMLRTFQQRNALLQDEIKWLRTGLEIIGGRRQGIDNLMSNEDIAIAYLDAGEVECICGIVQEHESGPCRATRHRCVLVSKDREALDAGESSGEVSE